MHTGIHDISYLYLGLLPYLPFCSPKFVNKEVENSNEMLIKSVRKLKMSPHLHGGLLRFVMMSSQIPTLARVGGGGGSGFQLISALELASPMEAGPPPS